MGLELSTFLTIQIQPTFGSKESYLLGCLTNNTGKVGWYLIQGPDACKSSWDRPMEGFLIDDGKAKKILACAGSLKISVMPDHIFGLDGTLTTVSITRGFNKIELIWWWKAPKQWKRVEKLVEMVRRVASEAAGVKPEGG